MKKSAGFTFVEVLVVLGIGAVLAVVVFLGLSRLSDAEDLDLTVGSMVTFLRGAQGRAISQDSSSEWGVRFDNPSGASADNYMLFSGPTFTSATSTATLPSSVEFSDPDSGSNIDVVFAKRTGLPSSAESVTIRLVDDVSETRTILINANGSIDY